MKVGDTFFVGDIEYSIKNIEMVLTSKFPTGRVDASKFTGSYDDGDRTIQRGRPKAFHFSTVADILGEDVVVPEVVSDVSVSPETEESWSALRESTPEELTETLGTLSDW